MALMRHKFSCTTPADISGRSADEIKGWWDENCIKKGGTPENPQTLEITQWTSELDNVTRWIVTGWGWHDVEEDS